MRDALAAMLEHRINLLLVAAPATWVLARAMPESPWIFDTAAVSLVPLARPSSASQPTSSRFAQEPRSAVS